MEIKNSLSFLQHLPTILIVIAITVIVFFYRYEIYNFLVEKYNQLADFINEKL